VDAGNTVTDNYYTGLVCTPDLSQLNIYLPGFYIVTFDITDPSGNKALQMKRTVQVRAGANGIDANADENRFSIYPNPNNGKVNIEMNIAGKANIMVFDANGKLVYSDDIANALNNKIQLDLSNEAPGMYFVKVVSENYSATKAITIQK
jgi:hypothetical protein